MSPIEDLHFFQPNLYPTFIQPLEKPVGKFQPLEIDLIEGLPYGLPFQISVQNRRIL